MVFRYAGYVLVGNVNKDHDYNLLSFIDRTDGVTQQ